jgi:hypothetical protein
MIMAMTIAMTAGNRTIRNLGMGMMTNTKNAKTKNVVKISKILIDKLAKDIFNSRRDASKVDFIASTILGANCARAMMTIRTNGM